MDDSRLLQESNLTTRQPHWAPNHVRQATTSEGLAQVLYVAARIGFEPATLRMQGTELTTGPPRPLLKPRLNRTVRQLGCVRVNTAKGTYPKYPHTHTSCPSYFGCWTKFCPPSG